jgi:hypothetical protein
MHETTPDLRERKGSAIHASWTAAAVAAFREDLARSLRPTPFVIGGIAGLFLAYLGPFETHTATLAKRYIYWPGVIITGTLFGIVISSAVGALFDRDAERPLLSALFTAAVLTPTGALFVLMATHAIFGAHVMTYTALLAPVFLLSLAMTGVNYLAERRQHSLPAASTAPAAAPTSKTVRFIERLPFRLRDAQIYAVQAEDHYLRVHTSRGSDLILLRLSDAIAELDPIEGAQTHRSWWVARAAITDVHRGDGRATLVLRDGAEAPVSRGYLPSLRDKGWL